jgi:hypothetical protein
VLGGDGLCVFVAVDVDLGSGDPPAHYESMLPEVADAAGRWYTEPLFVLLAFDLAAVDGRTAQVTSSYQDDGMVTASHLTVTLQNLVD